MRPRVPLTAGRTTLEKFNKLIEDIGRDPFTSIGKPDWLRCHG